MTLKKPTRNWRWINALLFLSALTGCTISLSRPPTFRDYQRAVRKDAADATLDAQLAVFTAAQLSQKELQRILNRGNTEELVGGGVQAPMNEPLGRTLLARAAEVSPDSSAVWAALAYRDLALLQNQPATLGTVVEDCTRAINRWRSLEPTNSAPLYLEAAFQCLQINVVAATRLMGEAERKQGFETCSLAIQKCVIRTLESAGRSHYIARLCAMGQVTGVVGWSRLSKGILAEIPENEEAVRSCLELGTRVARGKSFLEELIGFNIQTKAMEHLPSKDFTAEKSRISERKARIKRATAYTTSLEKQKISATKISEDRWVRFMDACFEKGEMTAVESLAAENGDTF